MRADCEHIKTHVKMQTMIFNDSVLSPVLSHEMEVLVAYLNAGI